MISETTTGKTDSHGQMNISIETFYNTTYIMWSVRVFFSFCRRISTDIKSRTTFRHWEIPVEQYGREKTLLRIIIVMAAAATGAKCVHLAKTTHYK